MWGVSFPSHETTVKFYESFNSDEPSVFYIWEIGASPHEKVDCKVLNNCSTDDSVTKIVPYDPLRHLL